jgi:protein-tyrosine-phosphatase
VSVETEKAELKPDNLALLYYLRYAGELWRLRIFFVCEGNSCRSVIAEHVFKEMLKRSNVQGIQVCSRGLDVRHFSTGFYTDKVMKEEYGIDVSKHVPRELNKEEGDSADLILTMSKEQKERAIYYGWAPPERTFTLGEYIGDGEASEIRDPYGGNVEDYRETAKKIERCLSKLMTMVLKEC